MRPSVFVVSKKIAKGDVAFITLEGDQENILNTTMLESLLDTLNSVIKNELFIGAALASAHSIFSSGPDITMLSSPNSREFRHWWDLFTTVYRTMLYYPKPIVATINGHCPSLACALVMSCDERLMSPFKVTNKEDHMIGFIDASLGMILPQFITAQYVASVGCRLAEAHIRSGKMLTAAEAHSVGFIDDLVMESMLAKRACEVISRHVAVPRHSWLMTKAMLRGDVGFNTGNFSYHHLVSAEYGNHLTLSNVYDRIATK